MTMYILVHIYVDSCRHVYHSSWAMCVSAIFFWAVCVFDLCVCVPNYVCVIQPVHSTGWVGGGVGAKLGCNIVFLMRTKSYKISSFILLSSCLPWRLCKNGGGRRSCLRAEFFTEAESEKEFVRTHSQPAKTNILKLYFQKLAAKRSCPHMRWCTCVCVRACVRA